MLSKALRDASVDECVHHGGMDLSMSVCGHYTSPTAWLCGPFARHLLHILDVIRASCCKCCPFQCQCVVVLVVGGV